MTTSQDIVAHRMRLIKTAVSLFRMPYVDAEDAAQDAMILAIANVHQYHSEKGALVSWLIRIMVNKVRSNIRKSHRIVYGEAAEVAYDMAIDDMPLQDRRLEMQDAISMINAEMRDPATAILLRGLANDARQQDIAEELGVAIGTVKSRTSRLRQRMEKQL